MAQVSQSIPGLKRKRFLSLSLPIPVASFRPFRCHNRNARKSPARGKVCDLFFSIDVISSTKGAEPLPVGRQLHVVAPHLRLRLPTRSPTLPRSTPVRSQRSASPSCAPPPTRSSPTTRSPPAPPPTVQLLLLAIREAPYEAAQATRTQVHVSGMAVPADNHIPCLDVAMH